MVWTALFIPGATEGIRTLDLAFTKRLLYRLSYGGLAAGIIPRQLSIAQAPTYGFSLRRMTIRR